MARRHSFAELRARMSPEARAAAEAEAKRLDTEMNLAEAPRAIFLPAFARSISYESWSHFRYG